MLSHSVSLVLRHIQAWRNPGEMLSSLQALGDRCRNVKDIEILESVQDFQMERERILSEQRDIHDFQNADIALSETARQLQSQRMELHQVNQLSDQAQREKSWLCEELEKKKHIFSGRSCQGLPRN